MRPEEIDWWYDIGLMSDDEIYKAITALQEEIDNFGPADAPDTANDFNRLQMEQDRLIDALETRETDYRMELSE